MDKKEIEALVQKQRAFFARGEPLDVNYRVKALRRFGAVLVEYEERILEALRSDMRKPPFEAYVSELAIVYEEIHFAIKHLKCWAKPKRVRTPITHFPAKSYVYSEPYGMVLIISPWNYPLQLLLTPLVGAIAAGNTAILKPSQYAPQTEKLITEMISKTFDPGYIASCEGGRQASQILLEQKFDYIFFTGSTTVGRVVMEAAAKHLTPVTLELGGKSPCIVDEEINLDIAARRIVWGKFFNAGQTCVAPDYLLVHHAVKDKLLERMKQMIKEFFGADAHKSPDYPRIINEKHFDRLKNLLTGADILAGGNFDREHLSITPTLVGLPSLDHPLMGEEIFGPILPIFTFRDFQEVKTIIQKFPKPLAFYLFTKNTALQEKALQEIPFGGGCINDTIVHLDNPQLPFGGVGASGLGSYHGKASFETFSHKKSVVHKCFFLDIKIRYPPYLGKLALIKRIKKRPNFQG